jgi:hypothetical protein
MGSSALFGWTFQPTLEVMTKKIAPTAETPTSASNKRRCFDTGQFHLEFRKGRNLPLIAISGHISAITPSIATQASGSGMANRNRLD